MMYYHNVFVDTFLLLTLPISAKITNEFYYQINVVINE